MTGPVTPDLGALRDRYDIVGNVDVPGAASAALARHREDGRDVLITVWTAQAGIDAAALPQLAADAGLLAAERPPAIVPVVESAWISDSALALVTEWVRWPSVHETIRRGEPLPFARIAAILREVNGALSWAREAKVVHRVVRPESLFVEPGSDHVAVMFVPGPLPLEGVSDPRTDARTIASLARTMLIGRGESEAEEPVSLAVARPDLPTRLVEATDALLALNAPPGEVLDAHGYVAMIAMAEALKAADLERAQVSDALRLEQETARAKLEAERQAWEKKTADEARRFAEEKAALTAALAKEREALLAEVERERNELARLRDMLERSITRERDQLAAIREQLVEAGVEPEGGLAALPVPLVLPRVQAPMRDARPRQQTDETTIVTVPPPRRSHRGALATAGALLGLAILILGTAYGIRHSKLAAGNAGPEPRLISLPSVVDSAAGAVAPVDTSALVNPNARPAPAAPVPGRTVFPPATTPAVDSPPPAPAYTPPPAPRRAVRRDTTPTRVDTQPAPIPAMPVGPPPQDTPAIPKPPPSNLAAPAPSAPTRPDSSRPR